MAKREWRLSVGVDTVLEKDSFSKAEKKLDELREPIEVNIDLKEAEKKITGLNSRLDSFERREKELGKELSKAMENKDEKATKKVIEEQNKVTEQLRKIKQERKDINSELKTYQEKTKAAKGATKKLTDEERKLRDLIGMSAVRRTPSVKKAKASDSGDAAAAKAETEANEKLVESIENVGKAQRKNRTSKPKVDGVGEINKQIKANENLAKSHKKVADAIERTAEEQKKLDDLNRMASNQKDWIKYLDRALDKGQFETSGKRDATDKLRSATNYLVTQRKESYQNAHGEYAKEMAEVIWMHAYQEAEKQGVAQSVLNKYDTDAKNNYESNLKTLQEARDFRQERLEDTLKQIEASDVLASSYKKVEDAAKAAGEAEKNNAKNTAKKPELLEHVEVLEDREPMQDAKTVAQKRKAAEDMLREQWRFYQDMKKEYDDPENATHIYGTDYEGLLQQGQRLEAYIALYEKYGGSVEKVGKKLKAFSDEQGFTGAYQYAVDEYNEQLRVTERQETANEELSESAKAVVQTSETTADAMREEAKAAGDAAAETERLANARKNAAESNIVKLTDNYGRALDDANNKLMQGTKLLNEQSQIIRLFHNSDNIFDQFDPSHISDSNLLGKGHYLSLDQMAYMSYGKYQTQWYANVQKMFDATDKNSMSTEDATKIIEKYCTDAVEEFTQRAFHELTNGNAFSAVNTIAEAYNLDISDILKTAGYDAIRANNEINVFDPSKIFRANNNVLQADSEDLIATSKLSEEILLTIMKISDLEGKAFKVFDQDRKNLEEQIALEKERLSLLQNRYDIYKRISDAEVARSLGVDFDEAAYRQALEERSRIASQIAQEEEEQKRNTADRALQTQDFIRRSQEFVPEGGFADGSEEMQLYANLLNQLTKGLLVADDAMELFRSKLVHTDVGETSIGQSILELEKITGKSLIGVLNDYDSLDDGIKEKVNSILKSMGLMNDQLEFTFKRSQGGNAKAVLGQDFVVLQKALEADEGYAANLIAKLKEAQELGLNVAPILERVFSESSAGSGGFRPGYEIQQRAAGSNVHETQKSLININSALQENQTLLGASENQLQKFIADYIKLDEIGVQIDPSKASNFLYDAEQGFSFIDLGLKNANDKAKDLKQIFKEITVVLANTSTFNALGQDESLGFSSGQIVAKVADSFEAIGIATREEIDSWAKEFYDGFGNIFDGYTGKTSSATQWIDDLRAKADTLDEEFKNSKQYKDFFTAIESGSITAADGMRKLEEAFNDFSAASVGSMAESPVAEIPNLLSAEQLTKAFDAVDLGAYFKSLNITDEGQIQTLKDLYTQFLQLSKAELDGIDVGDKVIDTWDEIISTLMRFGTVSIDARETYEGFLNYLKGAKFSYNSSEKEELKYHFGDWSSIRSRFGKMITPLSSGKGIGADQKWEELFDFGIFKEDDVNSPLVAVLREFERASAIKKNGWKINQSFSDSSGIESNLADQSNKMLAAALRTEEAVEKEESALKDLEGQAEKTANAKKKVTKANKELGDAAVDSKEKIEGETEAAEDLEKKVKWSTERKGGSIEGLNLPTQWVGEKGQDVVQMFADIKSDIEKTLGTDVKIDFVSEVNKDGELEAVGATLEYINKESGVTVKQFYDIARGKDDVITATQTAEKATLKATKAQKDFNAQLKQQLAYQQLDTFRKEMGQFTVDLTAAQNAANKIVDKDSLDEFNVQLKIARESLKGMKAQMKSQNTLDPIVAAEKRLKSLDSELESLKNKFIFKAGSGVDTKWIDDQIASIKKLRDAFNNEKDPNKKTGFYKQITSEIDNAENGMTNLNELIRIQNKLFKDRRTLSKMDSSTESYKILEQSVMLQGKELSNLIRNSQHKETIMKRAVQFENELAAATQDRINKQEQAFNKRYSGVDVIQSGSWDKNAFADYQDAMRDFANGVLDGDVRVNGFNKSGTEMYVVLSDAEGALHKITVALDKSSGKMIAFTTGTNGITDALKELGKSGLQQVTRVAGMYLGVNDFIRYFRQGIQHVRDIDASMTELRKVTDETEASYAKFLKTASEAAGKIGSTVKDFTTVTSDFARLGYSIEEASEMAKTALIYENVGDGFSSVEEASESIISTMKAFGIEAEDTMGIVDRFNEVGNNFAIDSKGIGDALQRSASALVEGGNSIDEAIALVTAANSVIQNPEQVGTALKTLSLRLRSTKIELEDMGEDAEGAATSTAKLREQLLGLTGGKVDIMLNETTFKNTTQILREIAAVWSEMDDISRAGALELIGGKRQANILSSLITNFQTVEKVIETSANSAGSALAENQKYIESIQGHVDVFNNSLQTFWNNFIDSGMIKGVVDLGTLIFDFFNNIGAGLTTVIGILGGASITTLFKGFDKWFKDTSGNVNLVDSLADSFGGLKKGIVSVGTSIGKFLITPTGIAVAALAALATVFISVKHAEKEASEAAADYAKEIKQSNESLEDYKKEVKELRDQLDSGNLSEQEAYDVRQKLITIQDELIDKYGQEADGINLVTGSIQKQIEALDALAVSKANSWLNESSKSTGFLDFGKSAIESATDFMTSEVTAIFDSNNNKKGFKQSFKKSYGDEWEKYYTQALEEFSTFVNSVNGGHINEFGNFSLYGTREEVFAAADQITSWLREYQKNSGNKIDFSDFIGFINDTTSNQLDPKGQYDTHKANFEAYLENTAIATYTKEYNAILSAQRKMEDAIASGNNDAILKANKGLSDAIETAKKEAVGNEWQVNWFDGLDDQYASTINAINFDKAWKSNTDEISDSIQDAISAASEKAGYKLTDIELINMSDFVNKDFDWNDYTTGTNDDAIWIDSAASFSKEQKDAYELIASAAAEYGFEINDVIASLVEFGYIQGSVFESAKENILDFTAEAEGLDQLATALEETVSAAGLSAESIGNIKSRYQDLDSYNPSVLFEETANGIHLNIKAARELEDEYEKLNKETLDNKLDDLVVQYHELTAEIQDTSNAVKRADLYAQRNNIISQINDTATLAARYEGLTSSFNKWQKAQEGPEERDMYESIISGKKEVDEEISRGWIDDGTREYLELMSGQDLSAANYEKLLEVYKSLNNVIGNSGHSIYDFFTKDDDGNSTADGVYNFFDTVKSAFDETVAWVDSNGKYHLDFANAIFGDETGDAAIANALGISEELVQIILRAASEAGFEVNLESAYSQFANLSTEVDVALNKLKELGATEYTFNINSTNIENVNNQIAEAQRIFYSFANEDGVIDISTPGAKEAQTLLATLIYQKQTLDDDIVLHVDTTNASSGIETVVKKIQDFKAAYNEHELKMNIGEDTTEAATKLDNAITALESEDRTILTALGIDLNQSSDNINQAIHEITADQLITLGLNDSLIEGYKESEHLAAGTVVWDNNIDAVTDWMGETHVVEGTVKWKNDTTGVPTYFSAYGGIYGGGHANGTAHANGNWGALKNETSLVGELGPEIRVRDGRWELVGKNGAEFSDVKKGDIIFNHKQTEDLLSNGYVTGRGKAYATGSSGGLLGWLKGLKTPDLNVSIVDTIKKLFSGSSKKEEKVEEVVIKPSTVIVNNDKKSTTSNDTTSLPNTQNNSGSSASSGSNNAMNEAKNAGGSQLDDETKDEAEQLIDFIEIKLEEIESSISKTTAQIANFVDDTSDLNKKNAKYNELVAKEKTKEQTYRDAQNKYKTRADSVLQEIKAKNPEKYEKYKDWIKDGAIAIEDFVGENEKELADLINEYREWDTKADEAELGWLESIAQQAAYRIEQLEDIASDYDNLVNYIGSKSDIVEAEMSLMEEFGAIQSPDNYQSLIDNSLEQIGFLQDKKADLEATLADAVNKGDIVVGTDEWYEAKAMISDVDLEIIQCREDIVSWSNAMEDLRWDALDRLMTRLEAIDSQLSHLFDRFTDGDNVVDDDGNWTNQGIAALGTAFQQRELAQTKANKLGEEIKQLQEDFAEGLYAGREEVYYEQLENLTEQQWEAIEAYEAAGDAIVDLNKTRIDAIKKGIDKEIDAYKELIEAKKEALDADKDSRDFERSVQDKQKEIDRIDRKIAALRGDNSASAKAQRKQLEEERAELQTDLEDLYYDRSVENQKNALDDSGEAFEKAKTEEKESLDKYLEDEEKVISDSMNTVKSNTGIVLSEIQGIAAQYGVSISTEITKPWAAGETAIADFSTKFTDFSNTFSVSTFTTELQKIVTKYEEIESAAKNAAAAMFASVGGNPAKISSDDTNSSDKAPEVKPPQEEPANEPQYKDYTVQKGDTLWGIAKQQGSGLSWQDIYAANKDTIKDPDKIYVGQTIKIPKYAKGTTGIKDDQFAWIDEIGEELVLHADGSGKLAYLTKGSSVIPSDLTQKLLDLAVDPTQTLENSRPIISAPQITNNEININMEFGEVVHIDTVTNDTIPDLTKAIEKQMDKYMKGLNNQIRKYSR